MVSSIRCIAAFLFPALWHLSLSAETSDSECTSGKLSDLFDLRFHNRFIESLPGEEGDGDVLYQPRDVYSAFWAQAKPTPLSPKAQLLAYSEAAAELMEMKPDAASTELFRQFVSGEVLLEGGFAYWAGQLGDGRAVNLGEVVSGNGTRLELQLKGSGKTAFSRSGDGRAVLRSSLREFIGSEFMAAVGIPTSRALSLVASAEPNVVRDQFYEGNHQSEPGAVVLRMAPSWIRFGTFEIFASREDWDLVRKLGDYVIEHFYPEVADAPGCKYRAMLVEVARRTGRLFARWQSIGFVHGVLNTDNMSILGITIDFGPFAFLDALEMDFTPNTSDDESRYTFAQQPEIGAWNLQQLGRAMTGILAGDQQAVAAAIDEAISVYADTFTREYREAMLGRLRLQRPVPDEAADGLIRELMGWMVHAKADLHNTLNAVAALQREWEAQARAGVTEEEAGGEEGVLEAAAFRVLAAANPAEGAVGFEEEASLKEWLKKYRAAVLGEVAAAWEEEGQGAGAEGGGGISQGRAWGVRVSEVVYVPRNYLMHEAIDAAARGEQGPLARLKGAMLAPATRVEDEETHAQMASPPPAWAARRGVKQLSCSS